MVKTISYFKTYEVYLNNFLLCSIDETKLAAFHVLPYSLAAGMTSVGGKLSRCTKSDASRAFIDVQPVNIIRVYHYYTIYHFKLSELASSLYISAQQSPLKLGDGP